MTPFPIFHHSHDTTAINVGEQFTLRIDVHNADPGITFKNVSLRVTGTPCATPNAGSQANVNIGTVGPGQTASNLVVFKALRSFDIFIPGGGYPYSKPVVKIVTEAIATIEVHADADNLGPASGLVATRVAYADIRP